MRNGGDKPVPVVPVVSNAKIKAALGMKEMPVRAKDGLRETVKSFAKK